MSREMLIVVSPNATVSCWLLCRSTGFISHSLIQTFSQEYEIACHTTYVACVNFLYMSGAAYILQWTPNDRFLSRFPWQFYLLSEFLTEICWAEVAEIIFSFWCLTTWGLNSGLASSKAIHYLIDYGVFWKIWSYLWCFLFYKKMCTLFKEMQFCVCFLKMFRPLKVLYVLF